MASVERRLIRLADGFEKYRYYVVTYEEGHRRRSCLPSGAGAVMHETHFWTQRLKKIGRCKLVEQKGSAGKPGRRCRMPTAMRELLISAGYSIRSGTVHMDRKRFFLPECVAVRFSELIGGDLRMLVRTPGGLLAIERAALSRMTSASRAGQCIPFRSAFQMEVDVLVRNRA